jgi:hypothetical protein
MRLGLSGESSLSRALTTPVSPPRPTINRNFPPTFSAIASFRVLGFLSDSTLDPHFRFSVLLIAGNILMSRETPLGVSGLEFMTFGDFSSMDENFYGVAVLCFRWDLYRSFYLNDLSPIYRD